MRYERTCEVRVQEPDADYMYLSNEFVFDPHEMVILRACALLCGYVEWRTNWHGKCRRLYSQSQRLGPDVVWLNQSAEGYP